MSKCFITSYPSSVNNESLPEYGYTNIGVVDHNADHVYYIALEKAGKAKIEGEGYFKDVNGNSLGKEVDLGLANAGGIGTVTELKVSDEVTGFKIPRYTMTYFFPTNIKVDIEELRFEKVSVLSLAGTSVTGDISSLGSMPNLSTLSLAGTSVTGDISSLKNLHSIDLQNTKVSSPLVPIEFTKLNHAYVNYASGDFSKAASTCMYIGVQQPCTGTWTAKGRQNVTLLCMPGAGIDFGDNLDNMLIDQATCTLNSSVPDYLRQIVVKGNRTSASDSALETIQNKGVTVTVKTV